MCLLILYSDHDSLGRLDFFFFRGRFTSFHTHASLLTLFCFFILFHSCCSHARVFRKTLLHEFPIYYRHTEWYFLFFRQCSYKRILYSERKSRNTCALVNLYVKLNCLHRNVLEAECCEINSIWFLQLNVFLAYQVVCCILSVPCACVRVYTLSGVIHSCY